LPYKLITRTDQGQGGATALEDSASLTVVLPLGTKPEEISERLMLYEKIRYERANNIQEYSRQAGKDFVDGKPTIDSLLHGFHAVDGLTDNAQ
jgi:2-polyprenyl-6-methoxyphenol hydroxylase-like FAD-dependent oxidoreductase